MSLGGRSDAEDAQSLSDEVEEGPDSRLVPFPVPRQDRPTGNLPLSLTSLVGRADDLVGAQRALDGHRLVTLVGPGGVGKTRLALEIGAARQRHHPDGVWLVDLSPVTDETLVPRAVASVLGVQERPDRSLADMLVDAL